MGIDELNCNNKTPDEATKPMYILSPNSVRNGFKQQVITAGYGVETALRPAPRRVLSRLINPSTAWARKIVSDEQFCTASTQVNRYKCTNDSTFRKMAV